MAVSPSVQNSTQSSSGDPLSPTTIIINRLKAQGVPITPENIRRAVTELGRLGGQDPTETSPGGLRVQELDDGPSVGQSGSAAGKIEGGGARRRGGGRSRPTSRSGPTAPMDRHDSAGQATTSAPPMDTGNLGSMIAMGLPLGMGAAFAGDLYRRYRDAGRPESRPYPTVDQSTERRGFTMADTPPLPQVAPRAPGQVPAEVQSEYAGRGMPDPSGRVIDVPMEGGIGAPGALPPPDPRGLVMNMAQAPTGAAPTDMEAAMQRAIAPPMGNEPSMLGGVRPYTPDPASVIGAGQGLPPGITEADAARAAVGPGGFEQPRIAGQVGVPDVPFTPRPGGAPRVPPPEIANPSAGDIAAQVLRLFGGRR